MFTDVTWSTYLQYMALVYGAWYLAVILWFYGKTLMHCIKSRYQLNKPLTVPEDGQFQRNKDVPFETSIKAPSAPHADET